MKTGVSEGPHVPFCMMFSWPRVNWRLIQIQAVWHLSTFLPSLSYI